MLGITAGILGVLYVAILGTVSTCGYCMQELESQLHTLKTSNQRMSHEAVALSSPQRLEREMRTAGLVIATKVYYVATDSGALAQR